MVHRTEGNVKEIVSDFLELNDLFCCQMLPLIFLAGDILRFGSWGFANEFLRFWAFDL